MTPVLARSLAPDLCVHCGTAVPIARLGQSELERFCCDGCAAVYSWLTEQKLTDYYRLREQGEVYRPARPVEAAGSYADLDDPGLSHLRRDPLEMTFYLEGFHCFACIWLLDRLPEHIAGLESLRFDPTESLARVRITAEGQFSRVASALARLGYRPHFVPETEALAGQKSRRHERRMDLTRLAVAGAVAGNIMMFALAVYAGAPRDWERAFSWISFFFYIPALGFSAAPLFREAWAAIRAGRIVVEVPLMAGIAIASIFSTVNLFRGSDQIFFDSLSSLLFLLLASRAVLGRIQSNALRKCHLLGLVTPLWLRRAEDDRRVEYASIQTGELIRVAPHEMIPVDGMVRQGMSHLNRAALTGESRLEKVGPGSIVEAGTRNQESNLVIEVSAQGYQTRLGRILRSIESGAIRKPHILRALERWGTVFVFVVAAASVGGWYLGGWERAVALLIIVCPCGLALAGPLTFAQGLAAAARRGIWVSSGEVLERLARVDTVLFDKTGTLTLGTPSVTAWEWQTADENERQEVKSAVFALEKHSSHPIAAALVEYLSAERQHKLTAAEEFSEVLGSGVSGYFLGSRWKVQRSSSQTASVEVLRDGISKALITVSDPLRSEAAEIIQTLRLAQIQSHLVSGDRQEEVSAIAQALGLPRRQTLAQASPEQKLLYVGKWSRALMVGDGANDAAALAGANVGVAMRGSVELALRSSDAFLGESGLSGIPVLLKIARRTVRVLWFTIAFSLAYNGLGIALVLQGAVAPWLAAIIMPLSALSVFSTTRLGFLRLRTES